MSGWKSVITSKTYWGIVIATIAHYKPGWIGDALTVFHVTDQTMLVAAIIFGIGALLAAYGRWVAKKQLTLTGKPPSGEPLQRY
jgi:hypothetical protein